MNWSKITKYVKVVYTTECSKFILTSKYPHVNPNECFWTRILVTIVSILIVMKVLIHIWKDKKARHQIWFTFVYVKGLSNLPRLFDKHLGCYNDSIHKEAANNRLWLCKKFLLNDIKGKLPMMTTIAIAQFQSTGKL